MKIFHDQSPRSGHVHVHGYRKYSIIPARRKSKTLILSTNVNKKSLETEFSIVDKWQSKTLFLVIFDPRSSIVKSVFDCRLSDVLYNNHFLSFSVQTSTDSVIQQNPIQ